MSAERTLALARFAAQTNLRSAISRGGVVAFVVIAGLGPLIALRNQGVWALDADLLFYGFLTGSLFVLRSGIEQQREGGLDTFLCHNLATPLEHATAAVLSMIVAWLALIALVFGLAVVYSGGDVATAAWHALTLGLGLGALLPFTLAVEALASLRIPLLLPVLGYLALAVTLAMTVGEERMVAIMGFTADRADPWTSVPVALRTGAILALGMGLFVGATWVAGHRRRARVEPVPSDH